MTAINLPGQVELPIIVDHSMPDPKTYMDLPCDYGRSLAKLLRTYEERPTSETWSRIQQLAAEILK